MTGLRISAPGLRASALPLLALVAESSQAQAHLVTTGLGPVYDGVSHFLTSPEDIVPVFAMALLAGQCGPEIARRALFVLPASWLAGGLAGMAAAGASPPDFTWLIFMVLGGLVAAHLRPAGLIVLALASALGVLKGFANGSALSAAGATTISLIGMAGAVFVVTALAAAATIALTWPPAKIAIRVLGSWTTATGLLLLGWSLR
jgi:hydrogenase/urease accessory protein HupE